MDTNHNELFVRVHREEHIHWLLDQDVLKPSCFANHAPLDDETDKEIFLGQEKWQKNCQLHERHNRKALQFPNQRTVRFFGLNNDWCRGCVHILFYANDNLAKFFLTEVSHKAKSSLLAPQSQLRIHGLLESQNIRLCKCYPVLPVEELFSSKF